MHLNYLMCMLIKTAFIFDTLFCDVLNIIYFCIYNVVSFGYILACCVCACYNGLA